MGVREGKILPSELVFPDYNGEGAFIRREAERRAGAQVNLVGPEREGFWLEGDEDFLGMVVFGEPCKGLWAVFVERNNRYVSYGVVSGMCGCLTCFIYACEHEVVCELGVEVAEVGSPVGKHGVEVKTPKLVFGVGCGRFLEERGEIEWVAKPL